MKTNIRATDRIIRVIVGALIAFLTYAYGASLGLFTLLFYLVALVLIITGITGYCYLYTLMGKKKTKTQTKSKKKSRR